MNNANLKSVNLEQPIEDYTVIGFIGRISQSILRLQLPNKLVHSNYLHNKTNLYVLKIS